MSEQIEAGRETDAIVAEKVMGATWGVPPGTSADGWEWLYEPGAVLPVGTAWATRERGTIKHTHGLPRYSTDRAAALEVVDRLIERGIDVKMKVTEDGNFVTLTKARSDLKLASAGAHTLALAICAAARAPAVLEYLSRTPTGGEK